MKSIVGMNIDDLRDPAIFIHKQLHLQKSLEKFEKYFKEHYGKLKEQENSKSHMKPKYHLSYSELALYLGMEDKKLLNSNTKPNFFSSKNSVATSTVHAVVAKSSQHAPMAEELNNRL